MELDQPRQLQNQQRKIRQLEQHIHLIEAANHNMRQDLNRLQQQNNLLQNRLDLDPISMILASGQGMVQGNLKSNYHDLQRRIHLYQEKILVLEREAKQYRMVINDQNNQLVILKKNCERLSNIQQEVIIENNTLKKQNTRLIQSHQGWTKLLHQYQQKWKLLENQILQAKTQLFQNRENHQLQLQKCYQQLQKLAHAWRNADNFLSMNNQQFRRDSQNEKVNELSDKLKKQSQIMQEFGRELDTRNDQIANLLSIQKASSAQSNFETYQHSLNQMIRDNNERERNYTTLLQKYQKIAIDLKESIKEKNQLQYQYENIKKLYEQSVSVVEGSRKLQTELQNAKRKIQRQSQLLIECDKNLNNVMEENDAYYEMMLDRYGMEVYMDKINEHLEQYNQRKAQRQKQDRWANTQELIEMNQKLMRKIRGK